MLISIRKFIEMSDELEEIIEENDDKKIVQEAEDYNEDLIKIIEAWPDIKDLMKFIDDNI